MSTRYIGALIKDIKNMYGDIKGGIFEDLAKFELELIELVEYSKLGMAIEYIRVDLDESGFTYNSINEIMGGYQKRLLNFYNSYTMNQMIDSCEKQLKLLYPYWYRKQITKSDELLTPFEFVTGIIEKDSE